MSAQGSEFLPFVLLSFLKISSALLAPAFLFHIKTTGKSCSSTECAPTIREMLKLKEKMQNKRKKCQCDICPNRRAKSVLKIMHTSLYNKEKK